MMTSAAAAADALRRRLRASPRPVVSVVLTVTAVVAAVLALSALLNPTEVILRVACVPATTTPGTGRKQQGSPLGVVQRVKDALEATATCAHLGSESPTWRSKILAPGWLTPEGCCFLYLLARESRGAFAEQGPFLGRSTTCIAAGLEDQRSQAQHTARLGSSSSPAAKAAAAPLPPRRVFMTTDVFPVGAAFADKVGPDDAWARGSGNYWEHVTNKEMVRFWVNGKEAGEMDEKTYLAKVGRYVDHGGQLDWLRHNLAQSGLLASVHIVAGSVPPPIPYEVIWSDASHNPTELEENWPGWHSLAVLAEAEHGSVAFAFHDATDEMRELIRSRFLGVCRAILADVQVGVIYALEVTGCRQGAA
jgi:hypothetical protein